jgi:LDH2 family malate/lactate/ureidoglycolate dehydrogenase
MGEAMIETEPRYRIDELIGLAQALFQKAGCEADKAAVLAEKLVEADAIGHTTHGLALAADYLSELTTGAMRATGEPEVVSDRGAAVTWDGRRLPGVWLMARAVDLAVERARTHGLCAVAIRNSHHAACLSTFLTAATGQGMMVMVANSDPSDASVAPFGGRAGALSPNPIAIGLPTSGDPILIDISASITTNGMTARLAKEGRKFPGAWAIDAKGVPTDDPVAKRAGGALLPVGGLDHGHKGFGLALMIEALTQGLSGFGRAERPTEWGCQAFVQVFDTAAFAGTDAFTREIDATAADCRAALPAPGVDAVRLPGQQAGARRREAEAKGVRLYPSIMDNLRPWAERFDVAMPGPVG